MVAAAARLCERHLAGEIYMNDMKTHFEQVTGKS